MQDLDPANIPVTPVRAPGSRLALLVGLALVIGLTATIGLGILNNRAAPTPEPQPSAAIGPTPAVSGSAVALEPTSSPADFLEFTADGYQLIGLPAGFELSQTVPGQRVTIFRSLPGSSFSPGGAILIATGTPAASPQVGVGRPRLRLPDQSLASLEAAYRAEFGPVQAASDATIDGQPARILTSQPSDEDWHAVALTTIGLRTYVIDASAFGDGPDATAPNATAALHSFLQAFRFAGPAIFASPNLGFEAELPAGVSPLGGYSAGPVDEAGGLFVFVDGTANAGGMWSNRIGVSVGSNAHPAQALILPLISELPVLDTIWGSTMADVQRDYLDLLDAGTSLTSEVSFKGEPAIEVQANIGPAMALITIHHGRVYIISTTGVTSAQVAPHFQEFLDSFEFLD